MALVQPTKPWRLAASTGVTLWGQDFFWTIAKPLAEFQPDDNAIPLARGERNRYMREGTPRPGQIRTRAATNARELSEVLQKR